VRARLLLLPVLLAACTSHSSTAPTTAPTEESPCAGATAAPGCATTTPTAAARTTYPYPASAGQISPLPVPDAFEGELVRKDNNLEPGVRTAALTVTVPAGKVLATDLLCQGRGSVVVTTQPGSAAAQTLRCDGSATPSRSAAVSPTAERAARTYHVNLRATGPSRWLLAVSARAPQ
jgi:hypothetical protein